MTEPIEPSAPNGTSRIAFRLMVVLCVAIALFSRLSFITDPFKNDAGIYVLLGRTLWRGKMLYQEFWETKLPSVALMVAPLWGMFGNHWIGYVVLQAVMGIGAAFALALAMRAFVARRTFAPALLMGLIAFNITRLALTGFQLETIQLFFEVLCACLVLRSFERDGFGIILSAGVMASLAVMAKPTGLAVVGAAGVAYLWDARKKSIPATVSRLVALGIGVAAPLLLVAIWVLLSPWRGQIPYLLKEIRLYATGTPWRSLLQFKTWIFFALPLLPLLIRAVMTAGKREADWGRAPSIVLVFAISWMLLEIAAVLVQKRLYSYHFLVLMPPAVMLFALASASVALMPIICAIAPLAVISFHYAAKNFQSNSGPGKMPASQYIASHSDSTDSVWADPAARVILETGLDPGARLQMTFYLVNHDDAPREFGDSLLRDFESRRPKYIVLPVDWDQETGLVAANTPGLKWNTARKRAYLHAIDRIRNYITTHYHLEKTLDGRNIFRRNFVTVSSP